MPSDSDGDAHERLDRKKRKVQKSAEDDSVKYKPYIKAGYSRAYTDNSTNAEFPVFVESSEPEIKLGNKNPLVVSKYFKQVKGIYESRRINANKIMLVFKQATAANDFLKHECLTVYNLRAFIPASSVERVGVVRFIPKESSNHELFNKLSSECEIIGVRRFMKKVVDDVVPLSTISVIFAGTTLPQYIYLDNWRYKVYTYIPPLMQCFKCMRFNHYGKICKNIQVCSRCAGEHHYKACTADTLKCSNCGGAHLAISKTCPIKAARLEKNKQSYAKVIEINSVNFPTLPKPQQIQQKFHQSKLDTQENLDISYSNIINNKKILSAIINTLVTIGNSNDIKSTSKIKEAFLKHLNKV
ncbi:uncharacterized protein LOC128198176 [Bicyclus anynana]|uniref:Uncharacterized protein LOC128198176 n=1 Tax=Bicyclus anynana TaxID=110368 RepID=A0ABM3LGA6_BICAN|nr:uncharacterized protein LOC128198176 [Bicyclus anynana]